MLVNNAGINGNQPLGEIDPETYRRVVEVNLTAPLFLIQEFAPRLRDGGRIVNISTGYTRVAAPTHPVYAATKAGLNNLGLALAPVFGPRGITINAVMPGIIDTDMNADWLAGGPRAGGRALGVQPGRHGRGRRAGRPPPRLGRGPLGHRARSSTRPAARRS